MLFFWCVVCFLIHYAKENAEKTVEAAAAFSALFTCFFLFFINTLYIFCFFATPCLTPLMENFNFFSLILWHAYFFSFFSCLFCFLFFFCAALPDDAEDLKRLNLSDLKARLRARGLSTTGKKQTLIERLETTTATTTTVATATTEATPVTTTTTSNNLSPTCSWEETTQQQQLVNCVATVAEANACGNNAAALKSQNGRCCRYLMLVRSKPGTVPTKINYIGAVLVVDSLH